MVMYRRLSAVLFPIMTLAFIGAAVWGYQENQEKNAILIKAENQYQRAFHNLSYYLEQLHGELGKTLAANSDSQDFYRRGLVNVWRITSEAQNEINQLPLTLLPFNKTEEFLANIAQFSYRASIRDLSKNPLTEDEKKTLLALYERSKEMKNEIQQVQSKAIANNLRWMDVESALATQKEPMDNTIIDGFKTVDKKVAEYEDVNWGPSMASIFQKRNYNALSGETITPDGAKKRAAHFLGVPENADLKVTENGAGTEYSSITVSGTHPVSGTPVQLDFTKKGGHLIYYTAQREVGEKIVDLKGSEEAARDFLGQLGFHNLVPIQYDEYDNSVNWTFVRQEGNVLIMPEKLIVKIALDNAEPLVLNATDYVFEHRDRQLPEPTLSTDEARKKLNPGFQAEGEPVLALIKNDLDEEVLCYQFKGRINGSFYKVYVNAGTGYEEKIEQYDNPEQAKQG